jgi:hypothetical protein
MRYAITVAAFTLALSGWAQTLKVGDPAPTLLEGVGFFLARLAWRAGRPRSQRRACWERERLARMKAETPCSATLRAGTPAKNLPL